MKEKNWILNISPRSKEVTQIRKKGDLTKHITSVHEGLNLIVVIVTRNSKRQKKIKLKTNLH